MGTMHKLVLVGRAMSDADMQYTPNGKAVSTFRLSDGVKRGEEWENTYFKVSLWGEQPAQSAQRLIKKGAIVCVVGRLVADKKTGAPRIWQGNDGVSHTAFEVNAYEFSVITFAPGGEGEQKEAVVDDIAF